MISQIPAKPGLGFGFIDVGRKTGPDVVTYFVQDWPSAFPATNGSDCPSGSRRGKAHQTVRSSPSGYRGSFHNNGRHKRSFDERDHGSLRDKTPLYAIRVGRGIEMSTDRI